jgi:riboflavin synthase
MFTGIIESIGKVVSTETRADRLILQIEAKDFLYDVKKGNSIAIDGACLTVTKILGDAFSVDVVKETAAKTTISSYGVSRKVNLEKALVFGDRLNGHIVQGHIDGTGAFLRKIKSGNTILCEFTIPAELVPGVVKKGSIAIDGISLTVADIRNDIIIVAVIPYTLSHTTLGTKKPGELVNIETDIMGKYILRNKGNIRDRYRAALY